MIKITIGIIIILAIIILLPYIKNTIKDIVRDIKDTMYGRTNKLGGYAKYRSDLDNNINPTGRLQDHPGINDKIKDWARS